MSMMRSIFRPGAGQVPKRFIAAFVEAATSYRGDVAMWSVTAPTSQGSSGVLEGKTLGTKDYFFVTIAAATASNSYGRIAGVYEGKTIGDRSSATVLANDSCVIVQTYGVHDNVYAVDATIASPQLLVMSTTAGAVTDGANSTLEGGMVGFALQDDATYTRAAVTDANGVCAFIRCDG